MFEYTGDDEYKATIELPNDGTPDSDRFLELFVSTFAETGDATLDIGIYYPKLGKYISVIKYAPLSVEQASELLYPAARIKTIKVLEPTGK